ncbi:MAG: hypothetical protein QOD32_3406 [Pyrinomonadaceae bacterium]|jgi:formylglycine-generating enzyme required for sulfatase activity|nr:hypothetical protein [Pyrinomonadaceae bacterium]
MRHPPARRFSGIFISYRREDSSGHAGRLLDSLGAHFGEDQIFMDIDYLEPGEDFVQAIEDAVGSCEILIALIGRGWSTSRDETGRRLDNPKDFVRLEIAAALTRNIRVIPVLVQGAQMPHPQDLPEDLLPLSRRHALELSDLRWKHDVDRLIRSLEKILAGQREERRRAEQEAAEWERREAEARQQTEASKRRKQKAAPAASSARAGARPKRVRLTVVAAVAAAVLIAVSVIALRGEKVRFVDNLSPPVGQHKEDVAVKVDDPSSPPKESRPQAPPRMVYVPGGEFRMGNDAGDEYEKPARAVTVNPFFIDQYEVTNEEYAKFIGETGHKPLPQTWKRGGYPNGEARRPVTGVTWNDAVAYAKSVGKRLPTEAEWEFAARGTDGRRYPWDGEWRPGLANADRATGGMADVGAFKGASPFDAFDMVGNAWEWTDTELRAYPGGRLPKQESGDLRVFRGGSYAESKDKATTTFRRGYPPRHNPARDDYYDYSRMGFRCAKDFAGAFK